MTEEDQKLAMQILDEIRETSEQMQQGFDRIENKIDRMIEQIKRDRNDWA